MLQTTITPTDDDWSIARFSLLERYLSSLKDELGNPLCEVVSRDRQSDADGNDPVLSTLEACASSHDARNNFDELWLFAVDVADGIGDSPKERLRQRGCEGITRFRQQGGGILTTRDHMNLGSSLCNSSGHIEFLPIPMRVQSEFRLMAMLGRSLQAKA
nr:hypothetical protein [Chamaesiphon sp. OTE_20_metabat_361]